MTILYNTIQILLLAVFWPAILLLILLKSKYRKRIPQRLGIGLNRLIPQKRTGQKTIWVHALSVGEVTSALPLVSGLRHAYPESRIIVTVTTRTGTAVAEQILSSYTDYIQASPLDLLPVVIRYIRHIQPDLFILVETDFWPNLLAVLNQYNIPSLLVNGRISQKSHTAYQKLSFFFRPMFRSFNHLCMQTASDRVNMVHMGVPKETVHTLGNLKYDTPAKTTRSTVDISAYIPQDRLVLVAGSTHRGEEETLLAAYQKLRATHPELYLIIAPRDPQRTEEISRLAAGHDLQIGRRSASPRQFADVLVVDTIGELVEFYRHAAVAFVGGSLAAEGGHNPIEPAVMGVPVLFGTHMEDFQEVSRNLIEAGGAKEITGPESLESTLHFLITHTEKRQAMGRAAKSCVQKQHGVIAHHIELIRTLL